MLTSRTKPPLKGYRSFGETLKELRTAIGMSVSELAREIEVTRQAIWKWERDEVRPRQASLDALAEALSAPDLAVVRLPSSRDAPASSLASSSAVSALPDVIEECKQSIAQAAGTSADKVTILIQA